MALVEPPIAISTRNAFSTDFCVMIWSGVSFWPISATAALPVSSAARSRSACTAGIAAVPGRDDAERLGDAGHGPGRAHHRAGAGGDREPLLRPIAISSASTLAGAILRPEAAAIGAGAKTLAAMAAGHHRPAASWIAGTICRCRAHQLRRHRLVAAADQHDRVHRLRAHHFLGVHRHQVAEHQAGRIEKDFAERDGRKRHGAMRRRPARRATPPQPVSGICRWQLLNSRRSHGDADDRLVQHLRRQSHRPGERAPQEAREIAVAVVGGSRLKSDRLAGSVELRPVAGARAACAAPELHAAAGLRKS